MTNINDDIDAVLFARVEMNNARLTADLAASKYRSTVKSIVNDWRKNGKSLKYCASQIGITEGALRELLRPDGQPRRYKQIKKEQKNEK